MKNLSISLLVILCASAVLGAEITPHEQLHNLLSDYIDIQQAQALSNHALTEDLEVEHAQSPQFKSRCESRKGKISIVGKNGRKFFKCTLPKKHLEHTQSPQFKANCLKRKGTLSVEVRKGKKYHVCTIPNVAPEPSKRHMFNFIEALHFQSESFKKQCSKVNGSVTIESIEGKPYYVCNVEQKKHMLEINESSHGQSDQFKSKCDKANGTVSIEDIEGKPYYVCKVSKKHFQDVLESLHSLSQSYNKKCNNLGGKLEAVVRGGKQVYVCKLPSTKRHIAEFQNHDQPAYFKNRCDQQKGTLFFDKATQKWTCNLRNVRKHLASKYMDLVALEELSEFSKNQQ